MKISHTWSLFSYICKGQLKKINFLQTLESRKFCLSPGQMKKEFLPEEIFFHGISMLFYSCFVEIFVWYWSCNLQRSAWPSENLPVRTVGFNFHYQYSNIYSTNTIIPFLFFKKNYIKNKWAWFFTGIGCIYRSFWIFAHCRQSYFSIRDQLKKNLCFPLRALTPSRAWL